MNCRENDRAKGRGWGWRLAGLLPAFSLAGCIPQSDLADVAHYSPPASVPRPATPTVVRTAQFVPVAPPAPRAPPASLAAQRGLEARVSELARAFDGVVGIAVRDIQTGWTASWNGERLFPQQSVSKFWVAVTALDRADRGELQLSQNVTIRREDLTLFHQPIRELIGANGYTTSLDNLLFRAITQSDNTANDTVLRHAGGPEAVRAMFARKGLSGVRFGPGERLMQSRIAGLEWNPSYSFGQAFYQARSSVPASVRRARFDGYIEDPVDGVTPAAMVEGLARLQKGELLSAESTRRLLSVMSQTRTGRERLTGGLAPGWAIAHKTGTGQVLGSEQTGYNDVGILTAPDGKHYAVAVLIGRTSVPIPRRMQLMQDVTRATIAYHGNLGAGGATYAR